MRGPDPLAQHTVDFNVDTLQVRLERAGHILGSAYVKVAIRDKRTGRTQELLHELEALTHTAQGPWRHLRIIVDSPLAARFNRVYRRLKPYWDQEARKRARQGRHPLNFSRLHTVDSHAQHQHTVTTLAQGGHPAVVITAGGMCAGGRVVNYLKAMLGDPRHHVLFVGYQAEGTPGRDIQRYGPTDGWVDLDGERFDIRAGITTIGGYSAHADQQDLLRFVQQMKRPPGAIRLVHGSARAREALANALARRGHTVTGCGS
ncbi:MBL fold metallo-hydrolase RNA specificity domain-containing protein [Alkalilimnicola ehrlichii]|uniref:MBL fold metallo-hydrolase RNA specificity domain-containing protein n=1 Tax=Alkalilimnicola ehrlichii TaxID=351052 RepID=UPI003BA32501